MNLKSRITKLESQVDIRDTSNLVELVVPWPDDDSGPIWVMVMPDVIEKIDRIYGGATPRYPATV